MLVTQGGSQGPSGPAGLSAEGQDHPCSEDETEDPLPSGNSRQTRDRGRRWRKAAFPFPKKRGPALWSSGCITSVRPWPWPPRAQTEQGQVGPSPGAVWAQAQAVCRWAGPRGAFTGPEAGLRGRRWLPVVPSGSRASRAQRPPWRRAHRSRLPPVLRCKGQLKGF